MQSMYDVMHICCCDECKGSLMPHSQGAWDDHLRYIPKDLIIDIAPKRVSDNPHKQQRQIKMLARRRTDQLHEQHRVWQEMSNGYTYVGTVTELLAIKQAFKEVTEDAHEQALHGLTGR